MNLKTTDFQALTHYSQTNEKVNVTIKRLQNEEQRLKIAPVKTIQRKIKFS